jgi:hypothetical protein
MVGNPLIIAEKARLRLQSMVISMREGRPPEGRNGVMKLPSPADLVITPCEVKETHGTGTLLLRMFRDSSSIVSLRTSDFYDGEQDFGAAQFCLPLAQLSRSEVSSWVRWCLTGATVRRVICFPYLPADVVLAIVAKELFRVPLCTYIMDDKNVCADGISDALMEDLLSKSDLRLVISPEMRDAYARKYQMRFWVMPPLVPDELIRRTPCQPPEGVDPRRGILIGNMWGTRWLDMLRDAMRGTGYSVDWYCNNPDSTELERARIESDGIRAMGTVPDSSLPAVLQSYRFAVVPSDPLDGKSLPAVRAIAELSLPSRIPTMMAEAHLPVLVLGNPKTAAARFIARFKLGAVVPYDCAAVKSALDRMLTPESEMQIRKRAASLADSFSAKGADEWIWRSLSGGHPSDLRFEELMPPEGELS